MSSTPLYPSQALPCLVSFPHFPSFVVITLLRAEGAKHRELQEESGLYYRACWGGRANWFAKRRVFRRNLHAKGSFVFWMKFEWVGLEKFLEEQLMSRIFNLLLEILGLETTYSVF